MSQPSFLQGPNEATGDPFRHAGIIGPAGDVIQVKDDVVASVPLEIMAQTYSELVLARHPECTGAEAAAKWARDRLGETRRYPLDDCFLVGLLACARAGRWTVGRMRAVLEAAAKRAFSRPEGHGMTCSAFVAVAFAETPVQLVASLASQRSAVDLVPTGYLSEALPLDRLKVSPADTKRMAGDRRAVTLARRAPLVHSRPTLAWNARLVGPGDLLEAPGVREVIRIVKGRTISTFVTKTVVGANMTLSLMDS